MKHELNQLREQVCRAAKGTYQHGLSAGTSGNVSALYRAEGWMAITATGLDYDLMGPEDVVVIDLEGNTIAGERAPSSEWRMHAELYKALPHVGAVVHTHSPYATSFAVAHREIPVILVEMLPYIKGSVEVSPFAAQGSAEVGTGAVPILRRKNACLLANHGAVAVGETVESAYTNSIYLEDIAKIYHMSLAIGNPRTIGGEEGA